MDEYLNGQEADTPHLSKMSDLNMLAMRQGGEPVPGRANDDDLGHG